MSFLPPEAFSVESRWGLLVFSSGELGLSGCEEEGRSPLGPFLGEQGTWRAALAPLGI